MTIHRLSRYEAVDSSVEANIRLFSHLMEMHGDTPEEAAATVLHALADDCKRYIVDDAEDAARVNAERQAFVSPQVAEDAAADFERLHRDRGC